MTGVNFIVSVITETSVSDDVKRESSKKDPRPIFALCRAISPVSARRESGRFNSNRALNRRSWLHPEIIPSHYAHGF
jgi:hypothetical protein